VCAETGAGEPWVVHDLHALRAAVPRDHAERVLGHVISGVEGVYDQCSYQTEKGEDREGRGAVSGTGHNGLMFYLKLRPLTNSTTTKSIENRYHKPLTLLIPFFRPEYLNRNSCANI
jgi:hypothetical protein